MKPYQIPTAVEFGKLRQWLVDQGMSPEQAATYLGNAPQQRPMGLIADELRAHLKRLPKKV
jgi:hypothetical protein